MELFKYIINFEILNFNNQSVRVFNILITILIYFALKITLWLIRNTLKRKSKSKIINESSYYAIYQIIKYFLWVIAIALMLEFLGVKITVLIAGSAALLVGLGLGLQQVFNDFISGIILLVEGTTKIGDILEIDSEMVKVHEIGLRTSKVSNRDSIIILVPNSRLTNNNIINWTHQSKKTRFKINIGVSYHSNLILVSDLLVQSAANHPLVIKTEVIESRLLDFADSSINFQLIFYSDEIFNIEKVKSEIRFIIHKKFMENGIVIPFPQRDVHLFNHSK